MRSLLLFCANPFMLNVVAICGSTRETSVNLSYIKAFAERGKHLFNTTVFRQLDTLPHFNPDLDNDTPPQAIADFRQLLRSSDAILICTPEYAMGVPGSLKNAIDWTVSSMEFSKKPTALITASSLGEKAHTSLLDTLRIIEAGITDDTQLLIPHAKTKITNEGIITDENTGIAVDSLIGALYKACMNNLTPMPEN